MAEDAELTEINNDISKCANHMGDTLDHLNRMVLATRNDLDKTMINLANINTRVKVIGVMKMMYERLKELLSTVGAYGAVADSIHNSEIGLMQSYLDMAVLRRQCRHNRHQPQPPQCRHHRAQPPLPPQRHRAYTLQSRNHLLRRH